ncbi:entericidin EcnAB [Sphingomicrobium nitratireducens]|nr:entericidin EcnAB [Sphingomicrobium nitratireducens]
MQKIMTVLLLGTALTLAACNTVRGAGQDLQSAANATEDAIN